MTSDIAVRFGERVKAARARRGLSIRALSAKAGIASPSVVNGLEHGRREIWLNTAVRLATVLDLPLDDLGEPGVCANIECHDIYGYYTRALDDLGEPGVCANCQGVPPVGFECRACGEWR